MQNHQILKSNHLEEMLIDKQTLLQLTDIFASQILLLKLEGLLKIYECSHDLNQVCLCFKNRIADFVGISYSHFCVFFF